MHLAAIVGYYYDGLEPRPYLPFADDFAITQPKSLCHAHALNFLQLSH